MVFSLFFKVSFYFVVEKNETNKFSILLDASARLSGSGQRFVSGSAHSGQWWPKSVRSGQYLFLGMVGLQSHCPRPNFVAPIPVFGRGPHHGVLEPGR